MSDRPIPNAATAGTVMLGDLPVHRLGFGAMRLTGPGIWGEPPDPQGAQRVLQRAVELGVNFIDTADAYGPETNERLIAAALHPYPPGLVIATKGGLIRPGPDQWERRASPAHLHQACEASLKRLRMECLDVYQLHAPDPRVPLEESLQALADLQRAGKIRHIGVSNFGVAELERAVQVVKIVSVQNRYNAGDRRYDDVIAYCERHAIAFIPWYPLAAGGQASLRSPQAPELEELSRRHAITPAQAALAWLLARSPVMLPIPGTSRVAHLEENIAAAGIPIDRR